jgi:hypothetical protein
MEESDIIDVSALPASERFSPFSERWHWLLVVLVFLLIGLMVGVIFMDLHATTITHLHMLFMGLILLLLFGIGLSTTRHEKYTRIRFAAMNGMQLYDSPDIEDHELPFMYRMGAYITEKSSLEGTVGDMAFTLFEVTLSIPRGKRAVTYDFSIVRIRIDRPLPNILLDSHINNAGLVERMPAKLDKNDHVRLEGNFSTYFDCYAPGSQKIEALQILTPDLMKHLIAAQADYDVEMCGTSVYLIANHNLYRQKAMRKILTAAIDMNQLLAVKRLPRSVPADDEAYPRIKIHPSHRVLFNLSADKYGREIKS